MAGKPSKWSSDVTMNHVPLDESFNKMAMDREQTRLHFEHNEIMSPEDEEYEAIKRNEDRLRGFHEEPNRAARTWRRVR